MYEFCTDLSWLFYILYFPFLRGRRFSPETSPLHCPPSTWCYYFVMSDSPLCMDMPTPVPFPLSTSSLTPNSTRPSHTLTSAESTSIFSFPSTPLLPLRACSFPFCLLFFTCIPLAYRYRHKKICLCFSSSYFLVFLFLVCVLHCTIMIDDSQYNDIRLKEALREIIFLP